MKLKQLIIVKILISVIVTLFYCEFAHYYLVLSQCDWPELKTGILKNGTLPVKFMVLTDLHMMGPLKTVWIDRELRNWEMYRAFQTAINLHKPEIIFFLGDLTDEGEYSSDEQFEEFRDRFYRLFAVPEGTKTFITVGNHDIGFHYSVTPHKVKRFTKAFNSNNIQLIEIRGIYFVMVNSVALEEDGCFLCRPVEDELEKLESLFNCYYDQQYCNHQTKRKEYSRPILLQHFPLFRASDENCTEPDEAPYPEKIEKFKEKWDCLGKNATKRLIKQIKPRLVISGHTHHGCTRPLPSNDGIEITVPSFNWRNKINPSYGLFVATPDEYVFFKCLMPIETTVFALYAIGFLIIPFLICYCHIIRLRYKINSYFSACFKVLRFNKM